MLSKRSALILLSVVFLVVILAPRSASASNARTGYQKVRIGHLFLQPDASGPAQILIAFGADLVQDYPAATIAYAPEAAVASMAQRAAQLKLEFSVHDDYDRIFLPGGVIDARIGSSSINFTRC